MTMINSYWHSLVSTQMKLTRIPRRLLEAAELVPIRSTQTLCRKGDAVRGIFFVLTGEVRLVRRDTNGREIVLHRARSGFIAEASLGAKCYHCDLVAAEKGSLVRFPVYSFREALREDALFRDAWTTQLAIEVMKVRTQCERLGLHSAADRISHYIETEGKDGIIILTQSRKAWAAELGLTHEALYRALRRLQDDGFLLIDGDRIALRNPK